MDHPIQSIRLLNGVHLLHDRTQTNKLDRSRLDKANDNDVHYNTYPLRFRGLFAKCARTLREYLRDRNDSEFPILEHPRKCFREDELK